MNNFERGLNTGRDSEYVTIGLNKVWSAKSKDGASVTSYEKIGYHAGSLEFLRGVFESGCQIRICYPTESGYSQFGVCNESHTFDEIVEYIR